MFTGIVKTVGTVKSIERKSDGIYFTIEVEVDRLIDGKADPKGTSFLDVATLSVGASIAVDGVCQTVLDSDSESFVIQSIPETLKVTNFGDLKVGSKVNLEPAMKLNDSIDGHLVSGHVDCTGQVMALEAKGGGKVLRVISPIEIEGFVVYKGSITINGVSLTISEVGRTEDGEDFLEVSLIKHTLENSNLGFLKKGDKVNLEADMMARYAQKLIEIKCWKDR